ncbi:hypothetical protein SAMN06265219_112157 [Gracilimonas mengyeensis]|uniref:Uncharacterized protein n=2 Tax=Gracilimonas mengyeensis TaxID=1302730 RepID=A0A521EME1_9BACT|nr:hypothetical protein SAMN06265219_112157 [Gracilimonas mengyeensis]
MLFLLVYTCSYGQSGTEKEIIYISYGINEHEKKEKLETKNTIRFIIQSESFLHKREEHATTQITYSNIKDSLISTDKAREKAFSYLARFAKKWQEKAATEEEKEILGYIRNPPVLYYNDYFETIYVFEKTNEKEGILYEVIWESFIE